MVSLLHRATINKPQHKNIMAPLLHRAAIMKYLTTAINQAIHNSRLCHQVRNLVAPSGKASHGE